MYDLINPQALDFGEGTKLRAHDKAGPIELPKNTRGLTGDRKFCETLGRLLAQGDVITESPTVGSSGGPPDMVREVVESSPHKLYLLSARAIKNFLKDHELSKPDDAGCAELIFKIATENPERLRVWRYVDDSEKLTRRLTSVRPYDKRDYKDPRVDEWMSKLPPFDTLPQNMQEIFTNGKKRSVDYARARVLPFAMALDENGHETRAGYERILGLYDHGYPSFYRRKTVDLMQYIAKKQVGTTRFSDVTREQRKEAWKTTRHCIRRLYHLAMGTTSLREEHL